MGVYSANRLSSFGGIDPETIVANENYTNLVDAERILIESHQNDMAIFEAVIGNDFNEAIAVNEGTLLESELAAITEGTVGDFFNKIKEFLKKVWEKLKGIFHAFMVKISNVITRDNKTFVEKYKSEVLKKDLSKLKYKYAKSTGNKIKITEAFPKSFADEVKGMSMEQIEADKEKTLDDNALLEKKLSRSIGNTSTTVSDYEKDAHEWLYDDEEEEEGLTPSFLTEIITDLVKGDKYISDLKKEQNNIDKAFNKELGDIAKMQKEAERKIPDKDGKKNEEATLELARANYLYQLTQVFQTVANKTTTANLNSVKFDIKQKRAIFAKAAAFNPKSVKESAVLCEAAAEAAEYEVESLFDCYA